MVEQDTIRLLRECDAGIKMGVSSIDDVFEYVQSEDFKKALKFCRGRDTGASRSVSRQRQGA